MVTVITDDETFQGMCLGRWDGFLVLDVARLVLAGDLTQPLDNRVYVPWDRVRFIQTKH
ncbi:MAG: hypothetical protein NVSMB60_25760 [Mycobacterium sp.]